MVTSKNLSLLFDNFNQLTPYAVGFERQFNRLNDYVTHQQTSTGFPPYDIRKEGDSNHVIEMALAGFSKDDIEIEVAQGVLTVKSMKENADDVETVHRGISYRKFNRKFTLAEDVVVNGAKLENGMLILELERVVPEAKKPRLVQVK